MLLQCPPFTLNRGGWVMVKKLNSDFEMNYFKDFNVFVGTWDGRSTNGVSLRQLVTD